MSVMTMMKIIIIAVIIAIARYGDEEPMSEMEYYDLLYAKIYYGKSVTNGWLGLYKLMNWEDRDNISGFGTCKVRWCRTCGGGGNTDLWYKTSCGTCRRTDLQHWTT